MRKRKYNKAEKIMENPIVGFPEMSKIPDKIPNKDKVKELLMKIKNAVKQFVCKKEVHRVVELLLVIVISIALTKTVTETKYQTAHKKFDGSVQKQLEELKRTHERYIKMTKEELLFKWVEMFSNSIYEKDGNPRYNKYDCISAVINYLNRMGGNLPTENIEEISQRADRLSQLGQLQIRRNYNEVKIGDIVILNPYNGSRHCSIVYNVTNGQIITLDVNSVTAMGFGSYAWNGGRIQKIFAVSYSLWSGNALQEMNK